MRRQLNTFPRRHLLHAGNLYIRHIRLQCTGCRFYSAGNTVFVHRDGLDRRFCALLQNERLRVLYGIRTRLPVLKRGRFSVIRIVNGHTALRFDRNRNLLRFIIRNHLNDRSSRFCNRRAQFERLSQAGNAFAHSGARSLDAVVLQDTFQLVHLSAALFHAFQGFIGAEQYRRLAGNHRTCLRSAAHKHVRRVRRLIGRQDVIPRCAQIHPFAEGGEIRPVIVRIRSRHTDHMIVAGGIVDAGHAVIAGRYNHGNARFVCLVYLRLVNPVVTWTAQAHIDNVNILFHCR